MLRVINRRNFSRVFINAEKTLSFETRSCPEVDERPRHFLQLNGKDISPWHDLPLRAEGSPLDVFQGIIEITRNTRAKMEVETTLKYNPIVQD